MIMPFEKEEKHGKREREKEENLIGSYKTKRKDKKSRNENL